MLDALPNVSPAVVQKYFREAADQKRICDEEIAKLRNIYKRADKDGVNTKSLQSSMKARKKTQERVMADLRDEIYYMAVTNFPTKPPKDLFEELSFGDVIINDHAGQEERDWQAHDEGYRAGRSGAPAGDNKYVPGSSEFVKWAAGHREGVAAQEMIDGPGMKQADASRKRAKPAPDEPVGPPKKRGRPSNAEKAARAAAAAGNGAAHHDESDPQEDERHEDVGEGEGAAA